jgi:hypothetical protein
VTAKPLVAREVEPRRIREKEANDKKKLLYIRRDRIKNCIIPIQFQFEYIYF